MVKKIISGAQTGADQAGLYAAERLGLETGGCIPAGARTDEGPRWDLVTKFSLTVHPASTYPPRTEVNVAGSDGTVIFGNQFSPGSKLTIGLCLKHHKPYLIVVAGTTTEEFNAWVAEHKIEVLNVAGNRESKNPGIFEYAETFLVNALKGAEDIFFTSDYFRDDTDD